MPKSQDADVLLPVLRDLYISLIREDGPDLTARQMSVFLLVQMEQELHTIRGTASKLNVPKTAVTRAVDRLELFNLVKRLPDPRDRRSVLIGRTEKGCVFLASTKAMLPKELELSA